MKILLTRPQPGAAATAARLREMGHQPVLAPCLRITPRQADLPGQPAAIIITSAQAIPALPASTHHLPVFCVGDATAGRLRAAGFISVTSAAGDANDLFRLLRTRGLAGEHLLAAGAGQGAALARRLRRAGLTVTRRTVYAARPVSALPAAALGLLAAGQIPAALFFSSETAQAFIRLNPPGTAAITALALSEAVATALRGLPWAAIRVALAPTEADLLALLSAPQNQERDA